MTLPDLKPNDASEAADAIAHACRPSSDPVHMIEFGASPAVRPKGMPDIYPFWL